MKSVKSPWFMGICEQCSEEHSVRFVDLRHGEKFLCWACYSPSEWTHLHALKPFQILNIREWAKR